MIRIRFLRSFDESLAALDRKQQVKVRSAVRRLLDYFSGGPKPLGLGLRKLRARYWGIRVGLDRRVVFALENDLATLIAVGTHDDVRRLLK